MRLPAALLSVVAVPASVLAAPVITTAVPAPRTVAPQVQEIALPATDITAAGRGGTATDRMIVSTAEQTTEPFTTLGVTWKPDPATGEVLVQVRTRSDGVWTPWTPLDGTGAQDVEGTPDARRASARAGTEPIFAGPSDGVQVRVDVVSGQAPRDVRLSLIDPGSSPADAAAPSTPASTAYAAAAKPTIRSRAQWGADESIRTASPSYASTLSAVTVHHTASSNDYTAAEVPGLIRGFYAYHVRSLGWSDIGYNVLVDKFGNAWEGRAGGLDRPVVGAHAGGFNTGTAGISMIGNYETVEPSAATRETVAQVAAWKLGLDNRDPQSSVTLTSGGSTRYAAGRDVTLPRVFGHRDVSTTACPGAKAYPLLGSIRERAAALQASGVRASAPAPSPTSTLTIPSAPPPLAAPFGALDAVTPGHGDVRVKGWAIDPDATEHTTVVLRVDGVVADSIRADRPRPDVAAAYPQHSPDHGFEAVLDVPFGPHKVCATALDQGGTEHLLLGCRDVVVISGIPLGLLDGARPTADVLGVRVAGWVLDPDGTTPSTVSVRVDGAEVRRLVADRARPDIAKVYPGAEQTGYDAIVPAAPGARKVCVVAINQGGGSDTELGCAPVEVPARPAPADPPGARAVDDSCPAGKVPAGGFGDTATSVHRAAVDCALWWQLTTGLTADRYGPQGGLTRGQVASFLARLLTAAGTSLPASPPDAFDDDTGSPHERAINQIAALGVVSGRGGRVYNPNGAVSRDQMASYLVRTYEQHVGAPLPDGGNWYTDDDGSVHENNIARAARAGLTGGASPGRYAPLAFTDRGQVASFLTRLLDMLVENGRAPRKD